MIKAMANGWLSIPKPNPQARVRLLCFPYAGGGVFEYRAWAFGVPPEVEIGAVQLPGREARLREAPFTKLDELCGALAQILAPYLNKPFAFFGHSLGAIVAFELIRQLRRQNGVRPVRLFASGSRAPQIPDPYPPIHHLPDDDLVREVSGRYDGMPREILENAEMLALLLPALRADFAMSDTYVYTEEAPLDCPISCLGGLQDSCSPREHLEAWRQQTRSAFALNLFEGDHFFLKTSHLPLLQMVGAQLRQDILTH
jgi:medium-chain acyl-[acyl-carrier-protein] hydrolase